MSVLRLRLVTIHHPDRRCYMSYHPHSPSNSSSSRTGSSNTGTSSRRHFTLEWTDTGVARFVSSSITITTNTNNTTNTEPPPPPLSLSLSWQPLNHDSLEEENDEDDTVIPLHHQHHCRNTKRNHIYTEILEHSHLSKRSYCCKYHNKHSNRSSNMTVVVLSVVSVMVAGLMVSIRTLFHPSRSGGTDRVQLSFHRNHSFKVVQLTDLHYGEDPYTDWGPAQDINTTRLIRAILQLEQPIDLIIVSGDQITANNINGNATAYYEQLCQLLEEYTVPYAFIFGNHDDAAYEVPPTSSTNPQDGEDIPAPMPNTTLRQELMDYIVHRTSTKSYLSLSQAGPDHIDGVSNYVLNVYNTYAGVPSRSNSRSNCGSDDNHDTRNVVLQILLLDSGGGSMPEEIVHNQLVWYQQQRLSYTTRMPGDQGTTSTAYVDAIAFQHIPTQQFRYVTSDINNADNAYNNNNPPFCHGMNGENGIAPLQYDASHEIEFLHANDTSLHFLAVGHNHGNSYCCRSSDTTTTTIDNTALLSSTTTTPTTIATTAASTSHQVPLHLCFGRHSGYGGYGSWDRGARVYELTLRDDDDDQSKTASSNTRVTWKSWVRLENGTMTDIYEPF